VGGVRFGSFGRLTPINRNFGYDRGQPVDRYYIERFLRREAQAIAGRVLEIGDATYTRRFGGARVTTSDVLHVTAGSPEATLIGDLADAPHLPTAAFDCVILTQTLQLIYDLRAALDTVYRILKPGGVALATLPGISHIGDQTWRDTWYWNATPHSARRLFAEVFGAEHVTVEVCGNVLVATAFLQGLAVHELDSADVDFADPDYPVLITVRATKG
jgi:SAM-dependent methyltransferase